MMRIFFLNIVCIFLVQNCFGQLGLCNSDTLVVESNTVLYVKGDFINNHEHFENDGEFTLHGNLKNNIDILDEGAGTLILNGPSTQGVNLSGEFKTFNLEIDNANHAVFSGYKDLSVFGDLDFVEGLFFTQENNLIKFKPSSVYFDASDNSHIDGPAIKEGSTAFRFPIGKEGRLRPLGILETANLNSYQAEYFQETFPTLATNDGLETVSDFEYWSFEKTFGQDDPQLTLTWDERSFLNEPQDDLEIGYIPNNLSNWSKVEASTEQPEQLETDLSSDEPIPGYGYFTFATVENRTHLQDGVLDFALEKFKCTVHVTWDTNERSKRVDTYIIERSENGIDFEEVHIEDAINQDPLNDYLFVDRDLAENQVYHYRIKVIYFDGTEGLTRDKFILASCYPISMTLYPNPAYTDDILTLEVFSEIEKDVEIKIVGVLGRILRTQVLEIKPGNQRFILGNTVSWGAAEYFIWTPEIEEIPTLKFQIIR